MGNIIDSFHPPVYDLHLTQYGWEGTISTPLSEYEMAVSARDGSEDYVQLCAASFLNMSDELLRKLLRATAAYALEHAAGDGLYDEESGYEFTDGSPVRDILKFVVPVRLVIQTAKLLNEEDTPPAFVVELNCDLDPDDPAEGLEWAVNDGEPVYVGEYIGCSPWESYPGEENYINRI